MAQSGYDRRGGRGERAQKGPEDPPPRGPAGSGGHEKLHHEKDQQGLRPHRDGGQHPAVAPGGGPAGSPVISSSRRSVRVSASARRASGSERASIRMGAPKATVTGLLARDLGWSPRVRRRVPLIPQGTIGAPVCRANQAAPFRNGSMS